MEDGLTSRILRLHSLLLYPRPSGLWTVDFRLRTSDFGLWTLDFGLSTWGFQRLCTQNQLAGSRRTAASKARLTSSMMSWVEREAPSRRRVGISSPASRRHWARPTR